MVWYESLPKDMIDSLGQVKSWLSHESVLHHLITFEKINDGGGEEAQRPPTIRPHHLTISCWNLSNPFIVLRNRMDDRSDVNAALVSTKTGGGA